MQLGERLRKKSRAGLQTPPEDFLPSALFPTLFFLTLLEMTLTSVSEDARAILNLLMEENPHLKLDKATVDANVEFSGTSLPNLPGCIKSGAVSAATFAVWGALADQMGQLRYK